MLSASAFPSSGARLTTICFLAELIQQLLATRIQEFTHIPQLAI